MITDEEKRSIPTDAEYMFKGSGTYEDKFGLRDYLSSMLKTRFRDSMLTSPENMGLKNKEEVKKHLDKVENNVGNLHQTIKKYNLPL